MDVARIKAVIEAETEKGEAGLKRFHGLIGDAAGKMDGLAKGLGVLGGAAVIGGIGLVAGQLWDMVKSGEEANTITAQTEAVLKSTHGAAGMTAQSVQNLADKYLSLTGIDDGVITGAENMLLTFTNIGKNVFPQATKTALDMSVALGQDAKSSSIQLGKALNDPIHGITALQRVGVTFDQQQKDLIKTYMKHGDVAKAQGVILQELNKEFGGSAEKAGQANGGVKILTAQFENMRQGVGQAIITALAPLAEKAMPKVLDIVGKVSPAITNLSKYFAEHKEIVIPVAGVIGGILVVAMAAYAVSAGAAAVATIAATWPFLAIGGAIALLIIGLKAAYDHIGFVHSAVDGIKPTLAAFGVGWGVITKGVGDLIAKIGDLLGWLGRAKDAIGSVFKGLGNLHIPGFASGGTTSGGAFTAAEEGPELLVRPGVYTAPAGSRIYNARDTRRMLANGGRGDGSGDGGNGTTITYNIYPAKAQFGPADLDTLTRRHALLANTGGSY